MRRLRGSVGCLAVVLAALAGCTDLGPEAREATAEQPGQQRSALVGAPELVRDIRLPAPSAPTPTSDPREFLWAGDKLFFIATEATHGRELWVSDGTAAGTRLVRDLVPGAGGSNPSHLTLGNGVVYFLTSGDGDKRLWVSDGTPGGTVPLRHVGASGSSDEPVLVATGGTLFFSFRDALWKSDGTPEGTGWVADLNPIGDSRLMLLKGVDGTIFFLADDGMTGQSLWKSDGTAEGTVRLKGLSSPEGYEGLIVVRDSERAGGTLFFVLQLPGTPITRELWKSDGTPEGTVRLKTFSDVVHIPGYIELFEDLTAVGGTVFFNGYDEWNGPHLWKSDGTEAGTVLVMNPSLPSRWWFEPKWLFEAGGVLYFTARSPEPVSEPPMSSYDLWKSDGTPEGTVRLTDFPGWSLDAPECIPVGRVGSRVLFSTYKHSEPRLRELWTTDGTAGGTVRLRSFKPELPGAFFWTTGSSEDAYFFAGDDEVHGREPWKTDGTPAGTVLLRDVEAGEAGAPSDLLDLEGALLFLAEGERHQGLWRRKATSADAVLLRSGFQQLRSGFQNLGRVAYFRATTPELGAELWRSDGSPEGTWPLADLEPGAAGSDPGPGVVLGGTLVFSAATSTSGRELWRTDGSGTGTELVKDIRPGSLGSQPSAPVKVGSTLYFSANDGVSGEELWRTDGTPVGTARVRDFVSGSASSHPRELVELKGSLVFVANSSSGGTVLWTLAPDSFPRSIPVSHAGLAGYALEKLTVVNGRLLFFAHVGGRPGLWVYDGTSTGAALLSVGAFDAVTHVARAGRVLYFRASDPEHGFELWRSDGTASGTWRVKDLLPGRGWGVDEAPLWGLEDRALVFFRATDGVHGLELWVSDGSEAGTRPVGDVSPGSRSSDPHGLVRSGESVFFRADDGTPDSELWRARLEPILPDTTAPTLACPAAMTLEATRASGATASWPAVRVSDVITAPVPVTYSRLPGTEFPLGTTEVTVTARDEAGNIATCSFDVWVRDTTAPAVSCPANMEVEATGAGTRVTFAEATASDAVTASPEVTYSHVSGSTFALGETRVTATARDSSGNTSTCSFLVTVKDTLAPVLTCPAVVTAEASSASGATVAHDAVTASDSGSAVPVTYSHAPGTEFPLGSTEVTATATDAVGNTATCTFPVTVRDTTAPGVSCPADMEVEATGAGTRVTFAEATASDAVTASPEVTYSHGSGSTFPVGESAVTVTAKDAAGNASSCSFSIVVRDTMAPVLTCPADVAVAAWGPSGAAVEYPVATAEDVVTARPEVTYSHAPGSTFPVGTTPVTATGTDTAGNTASCSFHVTVRPVHVSEGGSGCAAAGGSPAGLLGLLLLLAWPSLGRAWTRQS